MTKKDNTERNSKESSKYKCKKKTRHIRLNIIDNNIGANSPEWTASTCDPLGSYTGIPENKYDKPVQDADDL